MRYGTKTHAGGRQPNSSCPSLAVASQGQAHFTRHPAGDDFIITPLILLNYAMICCLGQAFDIDGVLVRGEGVLPGARDSLRALEDACVPFVFVTNGGGEFGTGGCTASPQCEQSICIHVGHAPQHVTACVILFAGPLGGVSKAQYWLLLAAPA